LENRIRPVDSLYCFMSFSINELKQTKGQAMRFQDILDHVAEAVPGYRRPIFKTLLTGLLVGNGARTVAGIFRQFACLFFGTAITRKRFYMFLNSSLIRWPSIGERVAALLRPHVLTDNRLLVVLDDTTYGKSGRKIAGCDTHFDHASKLNVSPWIFGHCRVVAGVLLRCHGRWACLPLAQRNFVSEKDRSKKLKIHSGLQKKTVATRKQKRHEKWQKTKCGIAAALVDGIRKLFGLPVLIVCDSWFGNNSLRREVQRDPDLPAAHILSRLRVSCVLHDVPEAAPKSKRGRRRKYGRRLPPIEELAASMRATATTDNIFIYGRKRPCTFSELICVSKALKCQVKVVFIHRRNGHSFPLVSTDLTLTAQQMIEYYSARWKIESGFKELKHELGALDSQCRKANAVENHFNLCCLAMTLTWVHALNLDEAPKRRHPSRRSRAFAFADIRREIADDLRGESLFHSGCPEPVKRAIKLIRDALFTSAA